MFSAYLAILVFCLLAAALAGTFSLVAGLFGPRRPSERKSEAYECGIRHPPPLPKHFPAKFYLLGMLFLLFDLEAVSFYPWAVDLHRLHGFGLLEMLSFIVVMAVGYVYVWRKGGFQWQ